jgi:glycosyltransferase involved in cell wall biosynthesis
VIEHSRSGIVVDRVAEMADAISDADRLDPAECRRSVEERFSSERMVGDYERAYEAAIDRAAKV